MKKLPIVASCSVHKGAEGMCGGSSLMSLSFSKGKFHPDDYLQKKDSLKHLRQKPYALDKMNVLLIIVSHIAAATEGQVTA